MILKVIESEPPLKTLHLKQTGFSAEASAEISSALLASNITTITVLYLAGNGPAYNSTMFSVETTIDKWAAFIQKQN